MKPTYSLVVLFLFLLFVPLSGHAEEGDMLSKVSDEFCNALVAADAGKIRAAIATFEKMSSPEQTRGQTRKPGETRGRR